MLGLLVVLLMMWLVFRPAWVISRRGTSAIAMAVEERRVTSAAYDGPAGVGLPDGVRLDDYVRAGLEDLRIMLVQHARRRG